MTCLSRTLDDMRDQTQEASNQITRIMTHTHTRTHARITVKKSVPSAISAYRFSNENELLLFVADNDGRVCLERRH